MMGIVSWAWHSGCSTMPGIHFHLFLFFTDFEIVEKLFAPRFSIKLDFSRNCTREVSHLPYCFILPHYSSSK